MIDKMPRGLMKFVCCLIPVLVLVACSKDEDDVAAKLEGERISVLSYERALRADPRLSQIEVRLPRPYVNDSWTQPGGYSDNVAHHLMLGDNVQRLFSTSFVKGNTRDLKLTAMPLVAEGKVFGLGADLKLTAVDADTGKRVWQTKLTPRKADVEDGFGGGIAYWGGRIFAATGFGEVIALSAATGDIEWRVQSAIPFRTSPTVENGQVFVISHDNQLQVYAADDGRRQWNKMAIVEPATILSSPSPAVSGDLIVAGFSSGEILAMRTTNGTVNWDDTLTRAGQLTPLSDLNPIVGRPVIDRDRVIAVSHGGRMVAIDLRSGERIWMAELKSIETPWVAGDFIFAVTTDAELVCLSRSQGRVRWVRQLRRYEDEDDREDPVQWTGPVLASDRLLLASSLGDLVSVSPYTGEIISTRDIGDPVSVSPLVANQTVYVLTDDGRLIAYR